MMDEIQFLWELDYRYGNVLAFGWAESSRLVAAAVLSVRLLWRTIQVRSMHSGVVGTPMSDWTTGAKGNLQGGHYAPLQSHAAGNCCDAGCMCGMVSVKPHRFGTGRRCPE